MTGRARAHLPGFAVAAALLFLAPVGAPGQTPAASAAGNPGDRDAVLAVVDALFDGMREKDETLLRSIFHPDARLHSAGTDQTGAPATMESPIDGFIRSVVSSPATLDEVTFDEEVRVDGNLAMAWTPYNLFVNGQFQHCGVDVFVMTRTADGWRILQIGDTRRTSGCDPERRS